MSLDERNDLYSHLLMHFDLEGLRTLCFKLGVEYDDLRGEGRAGKARELIMLLQRQGRLDELAQHIASVSHNQVSLENRYIAALLQQHGYMVFAGMALRLHDRMVRIPLDELFVDPSAEVGVAPTLQLQFVMRPALGYQAVRTGNITLVGLNEIKSTPRSVILGSPGAGKSTLLHWLILEALHSRVSGELERSQHPLPIFLRLTHVAQALRQDPSLTLEHYLRHWHLTDYQSLIQTALAYGRVWLLLDGLDEIVDRYTRWQIGNTIETFTAQFPSVERIIVTSRIVGYRTAQLGDAFRHFTLQPFGLPEITRFVHKWFRAVYCLTQPSPDYAEAERRASRLIEGLRDKPRVLQLAGTPLFLALIVLMDWKGKEIPRRRVELYEAATKTLLEDWPAHHGRPIQGELTMGEMLHILAQLALNMYKTSSDAAIRQDKLVAGLSELIRAVRGCTLSEAANLTQRWLPLLSEHSGLLLDAGVDTFNRPVYAFLHLSFVEYLCGQALADQWRSGNLDLAEYAADPRWHEVLILMAGYIGMDYSVDESTRLVESIWSLDLPHEEVLQQPLVLVAACLADDVVVSVELRERILGELVGCWHNATPSRLKSKLFRLLSAMRGTDSAPAVIQRVVPLLDQGEDHVRSSSIELLATLGDPAQGALKAHLLEALHDPAAEVQRAAVRALGLLGLAADLDVRMTLLEALHHPDAVVRTRAVLALGPFATPDSDIARALLQILRQDQDDEPRRTAARVLGSQNRPDADVLAGLCAGILDGTRAVQKEAAAGFVCWEEDIRKHILTTLYQALHDSDHTRRRKTIKAIAAISLVLREDARDLLLEAVNDETNYDVSLRVPLIEALGSLPSPGDQVLGLLVTLLKDKHPKVRIKSAEALGNLGVHNTLVTQALAETLADGNAVLRRGVAAALGTCGMPEPMTESALERALSDTDELVAINAAGSLLRLGLQHSKARTRLVALLRSTNAEIRRLAAQEVQGIVHSLSPSAIAVLVDLVDDANRNVSENALRALAALGHEANTNVVAACRAALQHSYHGVRSAAAEALGRVGQADETTITALVAMLTDSVDHVRLAASNALVALSQGPEHDTIVRRVREIFDQYPNSEGALNTLWELVVGE